MTQTPSVATTTDQPKPTGSAPVSSAHASRIRAISYGGGVQSTALLVLAAQERIRSSDAAAPR